MRSSWGYVPWLAMCFAVVGLTGLFGTYGPVIPLERTLRRSAVLDQALATGAQPDGPARLAAMRDALGTSADAVLSGPGDLPTRVLAARAAMLAEEARETASVAYRTRLMIGVITVLAGLFGAGVLVFAVRQTG